MKPILLFILTILIGLPQLSAQSHLIASYSTTGPEMLLEAELARPVGSFWAFHLQTSDGQWPEGGEFRFVETGNDRPAAWQSIHRFHHNPEAGLSELLYTPEAVLNIEFRLPAGNYELFAFDPGRSATTVTPETLTANANCPCAQPTTIGRSDWCPAGTCPPGNNPASTTVTHLIVHHSAGTNSSNDWAGVVRAIWNFHVNTNGWDDVGYNYLVDPNGVVYVGRGNNIRGAHFCGNNTGTMGVCVLGNFTSVTPTQDALGALSLLLAWKACDRNLDPLTTSLHPSSNLVLNHVAGHRQGCSTSCPGDSFFPLFATLRQSVADVIANCIVSSTSAGLSPSMELSLSPNPSWGIVRLESNESIKAIEVYDLAGRLVLARGYQNPPANLELDLAAFGPGQFILLIEGESGAVVKPITLHK